MSTFTISGLDDEDMCKTLDEAVTQEQIWLWSDLCRARRSAINTDWSIQCENLAHRIVRLARLTTATRWNEIDVSLLRDGVYEEVLRQAQLHYDPIDWNRVHAVHARIQESAGHPHRQS